MRSRARTRLLRGVLPVALAAGVWFGAREGVAQTPGAAWAVIPSVGFGALRERGSWNSGGMEASVDIGLRRNRWTWAARGSLRGLGVSCSHGCADGGWWFGGGAARASGPIRIGGGVGTSDQFGAWQIQPYAEVGIRRGRFGAALRGEFPLDAGGVYVPLVVSWTVAAGRR